VRLKRVKESIFDSDEKLFVLPDILDEENGPYADLLDHLTRCRVKMLNDLFNFENKLTVDEVEDEIREEQNTHFIEGKAVHTFASSARSSTSCPMASTPTRSIPPRPRRRRRTTCPTLDAEEEEKLKNDESLKWDEDGDEEKEDDKEDGEKKDEDEKEEAAEDDDAAKPRRKSRGKR
jgi:hypothetical protein